MNANDIPPAVIVTSPPCQPFSEYRPRIENVCECGRKHTGPFSTCSSCQSKE